MLHTYNDFAAYLTGVGFMPLSNNKPGFASLASLTEEQAWHTGKETDPWIWRKRIAEEKKATYGKFFDKKPAFISLEWLPYFLAARRGALTVVEIYEQGQLSQRAKDVYDLFDQREQIAAHEIKPLLARDIGKTELENALNELQMGLFLTISGAEQKTNARGEAYGWPSICLMKMENWVGAEVVAEAAKINSAEARAKIIAKAQAQIPDASEKTLAKFLGL